MPISVNDGGTWKELTEVHVNDGGSWKECTEVHVNDGGTWKEVHSASSPIVMSAGANRTKNGNGMSECGNVGNTAAATATASGGQGSLTYLWEQTGTPAEHGPYNISNANVLQPTWGKPSVCFDDSPKTETWRLTVTDEGVGNETDTITVTLNWSDIS